jgi:hypothetical protein
MILGSSGGRDGGLFTDDLVGIPRGNKKNYAALMAGLGFFFKFFRNPVLKFFSEKFFKKLFCGLWDHCGKIFPTA